MCFGGGGPSADQIYEEQYKVEPEPLPDLPTSGYKLSRDQRMGMRNKPMGQTQRTLLNIGNQNG
jgi:hypothetical protein